MLGRNYKIPILWIKADKKIEIIKNTKLIGKNLFWKEIKQKRTDPIVHRAIEIKGDTGYLFKDKPIYICLDIEPCAVVFEWDKDNKMVFKNYINKDNEEDYKLYAEEYMQKQERLEYYQGTPAWVTKEDKHFFLENASLAGALLDKSEQNFYETKRTLWQRIPDMSIGAVIILVLQYILAWIERIQ